MRASLGSASWSQHFSAMLSKAHSLRPFVDVFQLLLGPGDGAFRRITFYHLSKEVHDDVLGPHLCGLAVVGASIASTAAILRDFTENGHRRVSFPHGVLLPFWQRTIDIALVSHEEFLVDLFLVAVPD